MSKTSRLPCPLCGGLSGYNLQSGSTHRWLEVCCNDCGERVAECRAEPAAADIAWNAAGAHAQGLRDELTDRDIEIDRLRDEIERLTVELAEARSSHAKRGMGLRNE